MRNHSQVILVIIKRKQTTTTSKKYKSFIMKNYDVLIIKLDESSATTKKNTPYLFGVKYPKMFSRPKIVGIFKIFINNAKLSVKNLYQHTTSIFISSVLKKLIFILSKLRPYSVSNIATFLSSMFLKLKFVKKS